MKRIAWLLVVIFTLVACSPVAQQSDVLTLNDIPQGSEGPLINDITDTTAIVELVTGVPTVCNVTYGTDKQYGSIATDLMLSGATRDHDITLDNLTPNTTYHFRLNLTDEQGNLYQSDDYTFTTQSSNVVKDDSVPINIASLEAGAKVIDVSSNFGGGDINSNFGANNAIDGSSSTQWSSNGDGDDAWIEIEFSGDFDITEIGFWTRTMSNNTATIFEFTVTTDRGETFGPFELPDSEQLHSFPVSFTASSLRFNAELTNTGNTGAVEIAAYGTPHTQ